MGYAAGALVAGELIGVALRGVGFMVKVVSAPALKFIMTNPVTRRAAAAVVESKKFQKFMELTRKATGGRAAAPLPSEAGAATRGATRASVDDKLARYLLNPEHPVGGAKAKWFDEALGFTRSNADDLAKQLVFDPAKATQTAVTQHGTKFNQVITVTGANGRTIDVTTAWIRNNDGVVRMVTAVPSKVK